MSTDSFRRARERAPRRGDEGPDPGRGLLSRRALDARGDVDAACAAERDRRLDRFGGEPAGEQPGTLWVKVPRQAPVERTAVAARQRRVLGRLGVDQQEIGDARVSLGGGEVLARRDADRLYRRA